MLRALRALGLTVLAGELLYFVTINVLLSTSLFTKLVNADPEVVDIHYARAWSFVPTRVHAEGLSIRATDSHVEWILRIDVVDFECSLLGLARKRLHVTMARGDGISFRVRMKVPPPGATPDEQRWLPPIDSLGPVGVTPPQPYPGTWSDKDWDLWTIHLEDVRAEHVREVWIDGARFAGDALVTGGFYLKPIRAVEVGPAHVHARKGQVTFRGDTVAQPIAADADFKLDPFDPRVITDADLAHRISLSVDAAMTVPDLASLPVHLPPGASLHGTVSFPALAVRIVKGVVRDRTHVQARAPELRVMASSHTFTTGLVDLTADVDGGRLSARGTVDDARSDFGVSLRSARISADSAALDLADPLHDLHGALDLEDIEAPDLSRPSRLLPSTSAMQVMTGAAHASAHVEAWHDRKRLAGTVTLHIEDADVVVAKRIRARGKVDIDASAGSIAYETRGASDVALAVTLAGASVALATQPGAPFLGLSKTELHVQAAQIDEDHPLRSVRASATMTGEVRDTDSLRTALALERTIRIRSRRAGFDASAHVAFENDVGSGTFHAHAAHLGFEHEAQLLMFDLRANGRVHALDVRRGVFSLDDLHVGLEHVTLADDGIPGLSLSRASFAASSPHVLASDPLRRVQLAGTLEGGRVEDLAALRGLLPTSELSVLADRDGRFDGDLAADVRDHVARGAASLRMHGVGFSATKIRALGDVVAIADVPRWDLAHGLLTGDLHVAVDRVHGGFDPTAPTDAFFADRVEGRIWARDLALDRARPQDLDYGLTVARAQLPDARALGTFLPSSQILAIESGSALLSASVDTRRTNEAGEGRLLIALPNARVRFHETHLAGDIAIDVRARATGDARSEIDLEGSRVAMRNVRVTDSATDTNAWSGDAMLEEGSLVLRPTPRLVGTLSLQARDASPLLAILLRGTLPRFLAQLARMPKLSATTDFVIEPDALVVTDLIASGADLSLLGTYALHGDERRGAFVVQKGPWSAGIRLDDDGAHLHLFDLTRWYGAQRRGLCGPASWRPCVDAVSRSYRVAR